MTARHLLAAVLTLTITFGAFAQEEAELGGDQGPDPAVVEAAVEAVLGRAIAGFDPSPDDATTLGDPDIDPEALRLMLLPLPLSALEHEVEAWRLLVEERTAAHSQARIELLALNELDRQVEAREEGAGGEGVAPEARAEADKAGSDRLAGAETAADRPGSPADSAALDDARHEQVERTAALRDARVAAVDRMQLALKASAEKGGDPGVIEEYTDYAQAVSEVAIDVSDSETALKSLHSWAASEQGGLRVLKNAGLFVFAVLASLIVGRLVSVAVNAALRRTGVTTVLLRRFLRIWIRRIALALGVLWGLSLIGVSIVPLVAALGAAGFILAFALQNSLSNFASGILIMFQKPFDAGDYVEAGGVEGTVEEVSLFCTYLATPENKQVIVPNNMIWEDVIVNATGTATRRLAIEFEVDNDHVLEEVEQTLLDIMNAHPDVLRDPAPEVQLTSLGADSMHLVCWPWVPTAKRDQVRWELVASAGKELKILHGSTKAV
jgi:small conductance mechanosensitive channel